KPYTSFVNLKDYSFRIYSREGNLVFETDNPEIGWDGKLKNDVYYPTQIFIYKINFSYGKEDYFEKSGTVTLVR
ncbi:MAG: gliding motility-associated C-terminal domain-containing protein, partial [Bacteroidales bacterium]|nr:gliding motility-associated C-terminal domain-containing protein [Bacteroidales bacterium]